MGKTSSPLVFVVAPSLADLPDFVGLRELGHTVHVMDALPSGFNLAEADAILGPRCQWYTQQMAGLNALDRIITRARQIKRANRKGEQP